MPGTAKKSRGSSPKYDAQIPLDQYLENTGKVKGFYICDSTANDACRYIEADRATKALDVKNGLVLFTKDAYLDK